ncbi:hypothetical protein [Paralcaligenes ginsengisoli]
MARIRQWPAQRRPRWVAVIAAGVILAAALGLAHSLALFFMAPLAMVGGWMFCFNYSSRSCPPDAQLRLDDSQGWLLDKAGAQRLLHLAHAWPAFAWMSLRFNDPGAANPKETMLELTVWKSSVSPEAWRQLCVLVARQTAMPEPLAIQEPR